nr:hypothetical protein [Mycoplasmopsis bovis]
MIISSPMKSEPVDMDELKLKWWVNKMMDDNPSPMKVWACRL